MKKIVVGIKRVVDYSVRIRVKADGAGVALDGVKMSINPFDEIALEEALRIRERGQAAEIIVLSVGGVEVQQQLRTALAMGADRAIQVEHDGVIDSLTVAKVLHAVSTRESPMLVLLGKQSIDEDNGQTAQMLAALWGRPQATYASQITLSDDVATVVREVDAGLETLEVDLPAVISVDLRLNEPRYVKLPDIMKAKKKPLETISMGALGVEFLSRSAVLRTAAPEARQKGIIVKSSEELAAHLKAKGLI